MKVESLTGCIGKTSFKANSSRENACPNGACSDLKFKGSASRDTVTFKANLVDALKAARKCDFSLLESIYYQGLRAAKGGKGTIPLSPDEIKALQAFQLPKLVKDSKQANEYVNGVREMAVVPKS